MPEPLAAKVRRVYRAQKRWYGRSEFTNGFWTPARNSARLSTAYICGITVAQVKQLLDITAGPKTTRSPGERT